MVDEDLAIVTACIIPMAITLLVPLHPCERTPGARWRTAKRMHLHRAVLAADGHTHRALIESDAASATSLQHLRPAFCFVGLGDRPDPTDEGTASTLHTPACAVAVGAVAVGAVAVGAAAIGAAAVGAIALRAITVLIASRSNHHRDHTANHAQAHNRHSQAAARSSRSAQLVHTRGATTDAAVGHRSRRRYRWNEGTCRR